MIRAVMAVLLGAAVAAQPTPALRVVVIAGEDAVNIVQQKTATAPVVEVRDRNNLPVPGAVVTFAIQGGKAATFANGASVLTITTNAAGQAAATGLTPMVSGAVQIGVEAAFQGQVATAAIAQVNVMTAAEAASAAAAAAGGGTSGSGGGSAAGAAASSGGGLSGTTIGIISGAVAAGVAGTVAATQLGGSGDTYSGPLAVDWVFATGNCIRDERYAGTLLMELEFSGDAVTGEANIDDGTWDILTSRNCGGGPLSQPGRQPNGWGMSRARVTGTRSNVSFSHQDAPPSLDGSGPINRTFTFTGSATDTAIIGTFAMTWRGSNGITTSGESRVTLSKAP
jgi:hypothetical protein